MKKSLRAAFLALALTTALVGCSSATGSEDSAPANSTEVLKSYFEGLASDDSAQMQAMLKYAAPDSPAQLYAEHQILNQEADEAANSGSSTPDSVTVEGDKVTITQDLPNDATDAQRKEATTVFTDFAFSPDGNIETWTAEPGGPLASRVQRQSGKGTSAGVTISAQTSYVTNSGDLVVAYEVRNATKNTVNINPRGYLNPNGRQVQVATTTGSLKLSPKASAGDAASITNGRPGGKLIFDIYSDGGSYQSSAITVPISQ